MQKYITHSLVFLFAIEITFSPNIFYEFIKNDNAVVITNTLNIIDLLSKNSINTSTTDNKYATVKQFGAKGDGVTDDTKAITDALNSDVAAIYFPQTKSYYKVSEMIIVSNVNRKKILTKNAKILNSDLTKATFLFQNSKNIEIYGGVFGYTTLPVKNGGNSQHVFQFDKCQTVIVDRVHIINSPEMGIAITNSNFVTVKNSTIEHTFRDGTYAHYSANIKYLNNIYKNIKDDAMSFHDYGIASDKVELLKYGYTQSTNLLAANNTVKNAYQGIASIGSDKVKIMNNRFDSTVIAGIAIFNSKELYPDGKALVKNVEIVGNTLTNTCKTIIINNKPYNNFGQASTGRAAIFIGSLGDNNQVYMGESKRLNNIVVKDNKVSYSGASGFWGSLTDNLTLLNNKFINCSGEVSSQGLHGDVVEINNVTKFYATNNMIVDSRKKTMHRHGYSLDNVSGRMSNWNVKGVVVGKETLRNSKNIIMTNSNNK